MISDQIDEVSEKLREKLPELSIDISYHKLIM